MRAPIFPANSNPETDAPILRKTFSYITDLLTRGEARLLTPDLADGVILLSKFSVREHDTLQYAAGSGFDTAWHTIQSGYAGPLTWQLKSNHAS